MKIFYGPKHLNNTCVTWILFKNNYIVSLEHINTHPPVVSFLLLCILGLMWILNHSTAALPWKIHGHHRLLPVCILMTTSVWETLWITYIYSLSHTHSQHVTSEYSAQVVWTFLKFCRRFLYLGVGSWWFVKSGAGLRELVITLEPFPMLKHTHCRFQMKLVFLVSPCVCVCSCTLNNLKAVIQHVRLCSLSAHISFKSWQRNPSFEAYNTYTNTHSCSFSCLHEEIP